MGQFGQRCEWSCSVLCYDDHIKDPARARQPTTPSGLAGPAANQSSPQSTPSRLNASGAEPTLHEQPQEPRAVDGMDADLTRFKAERQGVLGLLREWLEVNAHSPQPHPAPGTPLEAPPTARPHPPSKVNVLILDDNMYYASMRHAVYKTVREFSGGFATALLDCDLDLAVSRNAARASTVHLDVIKRMALKLEPPRPDKNRWEKHSVVVDASKEMSVAVDAVTALCFRAASDPTAPIPEVDSVVTDADRKATADSVRHQFDVASRKILSAEVKLLRAEGGDHGHDVGAKIGELNAARKLAVKDAKSAASAGATVDDLVLRFQLQVDALVIDHVS
eukprot:m.343035 g.343035  ORF g.343035 m.343035 type:complete len:335 (-) comp27865_c7_seq1:2359-3363(-)